MLNDMSRILEKMKKWKIWEIRKDVESSIFRTEQTNYKMFFHNRSLYVPVLSTVYPPPIQNDNKKMLTVSLLGEHAAVRLRRVRAN